MKISIFKGKNKTLRIGSIILLIPLVLCSITFGVVYVSQDAILQKQVASLNKHHKGLVKIGESHLAPFEDFPNISFKIDDVHILESKEEAGATILKVADIYIGFHIWDIIQ